MSPTRRIDGGSSPGGLGDRRRILDASVVDADDHVGHGLLHQVQVAEGQIALVELAVADESLKHAVDMVPDSLGAPILEGSG